MTTELSHYRDDELAARCEEEASKKIHQNRDDRFCYELIKRAFETKEEYTLGLVLNIYRNIWSKSWIRNPASFDSHANTADDFKNEAFFNVYRSICRKNVEFDALFKSLSSFLAYLYTTLVRLIAEDLRTHPLEHRSPSLEKEDDLPETERFRAENDTAEEAEREVILKQVDDRVRALLPNEPDKILFDCWIHQDMSRSEIVREYRSYWSDENAVRVALQRIRRRLHQDPTLYQLLQSLVNRNG
jgi:hypothetical protein